MHKLKVRFFVGQTEHEMHVDYLAYTPLGCLARALKPVGLAQPAELRRRGHLESQEENIPTSG